jgi:transcriptional regulator with XRE-family HTH domain
MRRTSLTPDQAKRVAVILREYRLRRGLSMRRVAVQAGCNVATIAALEAGTILSPQPSTLKAVAEVLQVGLGELYAVGNWLPPQELPSLAPYLRAKYHDLDEAAIAELETYANRLIERHGGLGPLGREDEQPL